MRIGIDIDDTISASFEEIFISAQKYDIEELGNSGEVQNYGKIQNHHYIETMYPHWTKEQTEIFWAKYFKDVLTKAKIKPYADEVIKKLLQDGHEIFVITSRYEEKSLGTEMNTREWLKRYNIPDENLVINAQDKGKVAKELGIDVFVDDSIEHCRRIQEMGMKALLMTSVMNQSIEVPELQRVYSWIQIYHYINKN